MSGFIIKFYTWQLLSLAWIHIILELTLFIANEINGLVAAVLISITTYDFHLRVNQLNDWFKTVISKTNEKLIDKMVNKYMTEHNRLCIKLNNLNQFWKNIWLLLLLTSFPATLALLHQVLFEDLDLILRIIFILTILTFYSVIFIVQYLLASLSAKMHKMCKTLSRIQWTLKGLRHKLKVLTYFERLSSSQRRLGISIGSMAAITFPLFAGVCNQINIIFTK